MFVACGGGSGGSSALDAGDAGSGGVAGSGGFSFGGSGGGAGAALGGAGGVSGSAGAAGASDGGAGTGGGSGGAVATGGSGGSGGAGATRGSGGSGGAGATGGSGGSGGAGESKNVALACGTTRCLVTWHRQASLYGAIVDTAGKPATAMALAPASGGTILTTDGYVAADGDDFYALHESYASSTLFTRLVHVSTVVSVKALTTKVTDSIDVKKTTMAWNQGVGMVARKYHDAYGDEPRLLFISSTGATLASYDSLGSNMGVDYGPFSVATTNGFALRWDTADGVNVPDCSWAKFSKAGAKLAITCGPLAKFLYAVVAYGDTVYSLETSFSRHLTSTKLDGSNTANISVDKDASYLAVDATTAWAAGKSKLERFDLATEQKTGEFTLPALSSLVDSTAMAVIQGRLVIARVPIGNPTVSAFITSLPVDAAGNGDFVNEIIP